jgi:hypothetical protein
MGNRRSEYPTIVRFAGLGLALAGFAGLGYALLLVGFGFLYGESLSEQGLVFGLIDYVDAFALLIVGLRFFRRRPNAVRVGWLPRRALGRVCRLLAAVHFTAGSVGRTCASSEVPSGFG